MKNTYICEFHPDRVAHFYALDGFKLCDECARPYKADPNRIVRLRRRCPQSCRCECHEPLLNSIRSHQRGPCPGKLEPISA